MTKVYWKDLTKKERKHLREGVNLTLKEFKSMAEKQAASRKRYPDMEPCWECRAIALKLGLPI